MTKKKTKTARRLRAPLFPQRVAAKGKAPPAHRDSVDEHAATELVLYIENTSDLSPDGPSGQGRSVLLNALRKWRKGTYDSERAVTLFEYLVESGAKRYAKEFGSSEREWSTMFTPATRQEAAKQLEASFQNSAKHGEYDHVDTRTGAPSQRPTLHERVPENTSLYDKLKAAGQKLDHHGSDLYVKWTPEAAAIIRAHGGTAAKNAKPFNSEGERWIDIPFEYAPFWLDKSRQRTSEAPARLDAFTRQYMETALWSSTDNADDNGGDPLDKNYSIDDIAPETRDKMIADCADFQERFGNLYDDSSQAGHDFWLSRNGHGTGFFDRDTPNADKLQDAAESYKEYNLYVGDDGMIYGS